LAGDGEQNPFKFNMNSGGVGGLNLLERLITSLILKGWEDMNNKEGVGRYEVRC